MQKVDAWITAICIIIVLVLVGSSVIETYDNAINGRSRYIANHELGFKKTECANLNSAWQMYICDTAKQTGKSPSIPENYNTACKTLVEQKYIDTEPSFDNILFIKGPTADKCYFKVEEPTATPH